MNLMYATTVKIQTETGQVMRWRETISKIFKTFIESKKTKWRKTDMKNNVKQY